MAHELKLALGNAGAASQQRRAGPSALRRISIFPSGNPVPPPVGPGTPIAVVESAIHPNDVYRAIFERDVDMAYPLLFVARFGQEVKSVAYVSVGVKRHAGARFI
jgi:hypothetical protein